MNWFERAEGVPNDTEVLLFTLLVLEARLEWVKDLKSWAADVLRYEPLFQSVGASGLPAEWKYKPTVRIPPIFAVINDACARSWTKDILEKVAKAIKLWDGAGGHDEMDVQRLKRYVTEKQGPKGRKRWLSFEALFAVASRIRNDASRKTLRGLLGLEAPLAELPTREERTAAAEERAAAAERERAAAEERAAEAEDAARKAKDAHRKAAAELKKRHLDFTAKKREKLKEKKAALEEKYKETYKAKMGELEMAAAAKLETEKENQTAQLDEHYGGTFEEQRKGLNVARARARLAEEETARAVRKIEKLEKKIELLEMESDSDDSEDPTEDDDEERPSPVPLEILPRRDESGRFQA